jgi:hypothetical protein
LNALNELMLPLLIELDRAIGKQLQVIVAVNDIPDRINPYVRLRLDEGDRLIPAEDLQ